MDQRWLEDHGYDSADSAVRQLTRDALQAIASTARATFDAGACSIAALSGGGSELVFVAADGQGADHVVGLHFGLQRGIAGWVASHAEPVAINDVAADQRFAADIAEEAGYLPTTIMATPVTHDGEILGVIEILDRNPKREATTGFELLGHFADQAAVSLRTLRVVP